MRCLPTILLSMAALAASAPCAAQATATAAAETKPDAAPGTVADDGQAQHRSAFGRVMAVMISSLQRPQPDPRARKVRTSAVGTPLDIEVGDAFRMSMEAAGANAAPAATAPVPAPPSSPVVAAAGTPPVPPPDPR